MKKAWELDLERLNHSPMNIPTPEQTEENWKSLASVTSWEDALWRREWEIEIPSSGASTCFITGAVSSMESMGYDVKEAESLLEEGFTAYREERITDLIEITATIYKLLAEAKPLSDHPRWQTEEYSDFTTFAAAAHLEQLPPYDLESEDYARRTYAGWCAQVAGGMLGSQLEAYSTEEILRHYPHLTGYTCPPSTFNDDITYELAFLEAFHEKGNKLTAADIALKWLSLIPFGLTAEGVALRNLKTGLFPPASGAWNNPYREWIGAQMRGAICGQVAPGNPTKAAAYAWMDGSISHTSNGILGEVFNAVMVSLAYVERDLRRIVERSVAMMPEKSEYGMVIRRALDICRQCTDWLEAWNICRADNQKYHWIHAYPNAAAQVVALWFGGGDFDRTIELICQAGMDTDCNAAQVMHIVGTALGSEKIDPKWLSPIDDRIETYMRGMPELSLKAISQKTVDAARRAK